MVRVQYHVLPTLNPSRMLEFFVRFKIYIRKIYINIQHFNRKFLNLIIFPLCRYTLA